MAVRLWENMYLDNRVPLSRLSRRYDFLKELGLASLLSLVLKHGNPLDFRQYFPLYWRLVFLT